MKMKNKTHNLISRWTTGIVLILAVSVLVISGVAVKMQNDLHYEQSQNLNLVMNTMSKNIDAVMQNKWDDWEYLDNHLCDREYADKEELLHELKAVSGYMETGNTELYLIDKEGFCYIEGHKSFRWNNTEMLTDDQHNVYVTKLTAMERKEESIFFIKPLTRAISVDGIDFTYLMLESDMAGLDGFLSIDEYGPEAATYVIRQNGAHIYRQDRDNSISGMYNVISTLKNCDFLYKSTKADFLSDIEAGRSDTVCVDYNGETCFVAYQKLTIDDWYAVLLVPEKYVGRSTIQFMLSIVLAVVIASIVVAVFLFAIVIANARKVRRKNEEISDGLRRVAEAERAANDAKTNFLSSMSHDIRTPMNAIIGMTTIASKYTDNPSKVTECLDKITIAGNHLVTLINDILDISKIESGKFNLSNSAFSITKLFNNLDDLMRPQADIKNQKLNFKIYSIKKDILLGDELRLNQVFLNLLSNAVKYSPENSEINVELYQILPEDDSQNVKVTYRVSDNGVGMTPEFMKKMYESFERDEWAVANKIQGSGMGLAIVKHMVDLMNGEIECVSEPGKGTTFTVSIVFETVEEESHKERLEISEEGVKGLRLLVAEDNDMNWEIVNDLLEMYEVSAYRAENGKECVEILTESEKGYFDAILMDVQMPVMDGIEATEVIRKIPDEYMQTIPIIALTADAFAEDIAKCKEAGMNGHVPKPININQLIAVLEKEARK